MNNGPIVLEEMTKKTKTLQEKELEKRKQQ